MERCGGGAAKRCPRSRGSPGNTRTLPHCIVLVADQRPSLCMRRHVAQPLAVMWLLIDSRRDEVEGTSLSWSVAWWGIFIRHFVYLLCVLFCLIFNPGFLFVELYSDVESRSSGLPVCAMWLMAPGTFVARATVSTVRRAFIEEMDDQMFQERDTVSPWADTLGMMLDLFGVAAFGAAVGDVADGRNNLNPGVRLASAHLCLFECL